MAKIKNKRIYSTNHEWLKMLADELQFAGRFYKLDLKNDLLIQYALPPRRDKPKGPKGKQERNKRAESAARHS